MIMSQSKLEIPNPLLDLLGHGETFCVAGCCGLDAFDNGAERVKHWVDRAGPTQATEAIAQLQLLANQAQQLDWHVELPRLGWFGSGRTDRMWLKVWFEEWETTLKNVLAQSDSQS
jgi:hypothetical protein